MPEEDEKWEVNVLSKSEYTVDYFSFYLMR